MKKSFLIATFLLVVQLAFSQGELLVHHADKGPYLLHTVAAKENFYSIGRLYNVAPKDIETMNRLDMSKGLTVGQVIQIPLNSSNFNQSAEKGRPVYYVVGDKEGLYRVSLKHNSVLMANLRKWNKLQNDNLTAGKKLIVGFLQSPEADAVVATTPAVAPVPSEKRPAETPRDEKVYVPSKPTNETVVKLPESESRAETPVNRPAPSPASQTPVNDGNGGYFKSGYERQSKAQGSRGEETATAGIFKTASGWQDAKYYALMDNVEPGTIIRIVNPSNNKAIYAKVLGEMSSIRQNQGYSLRMSNAAAAALEVNDTEKFIVRVNF
jgi:LysM repeat protein